jgi:hypothetical protein
MCIPVPSNEVERLAALRRLAIVDAPSWPALDRICRIAQELFSVPVVLITLVDAQRQHFKAKLGLENLDGTLREHAFCSYTILHDEVFVVPDATRNSSFADNPHVTGDPHIRFYAGAPLIVEPQIRLGSLCIIDREPRDLDPSQAALLAGLSRLVTGEFWLRHLEQAGLATPIPRPDGGFGRPDFDFSVRKSVSSAQVRAARALLNWSVRDLAGASGVSPTTVKRIEAGGANQVRRDSLDAVRHALERAGLDLIHTSGTQGGVRFRPE